MRYVIYLLAIWSGSAFPSTVVINPGLYGPEFISIGLDQCVISPRRFVLVPEGANVVAYGDYRPPCIRPGSNEAVTLDTHIDCISGQTCSGNYGAFELRISTEPGCVIDSEPGTQIVIPECLRDSPRVIYRRLPVRDVERPFVYGVYHGRMNEIGGTFQSSEALTASVTRTAGGVRFELSAIGPKLPSGMHESFRQRDWVAQEKPVMTVIHSSPERRYFYQQSISAVSITESNGATVVLSQQDSLRRDLVNILSETDELVDPRRIPGKFKIYGSDDYGIKEFELRRCIEQKDSSGGFVLSIDCPIYRYEKFAGQLLCKAKTDNLGAVLGGNECDLVINGSNGTMVKRMRESLFGLDAWYNDEVYDSSREYVLVSIPFALRVE